MMVDKKAPAAWHGDTGQEAFDIRSVVARHGKVELLRGIMRDVTALHRAGLWPASYERCVAALADHRQRAQSATPLVIIARVLANCRREWLCEPNWRAHR